MNENDIIKCSRCGGVCTHQQHVTLYSRSEDQTCEPLTIDNRDNRILKRSETIIMENPSLRRQGIIVTLQCEECNSNTYLNISQHKGSTYISTGNSFSGYKKLEF